MAIQWPKACEGMAFVARTRPHRAACHHLRVHERRCGGVRTLQLKSLCLPLSGFYATKLARVGSFADDLMTSRREAGQWGYGELRSCAEL